MDKLIWLPEYVLITLSQMIFIKYGLHGVYITLTEILALWGIDVFLHNSLQRALAFHTFSELVSSWDR